MKQLATLVQLGEEDPDVDYDDLQEIVELARTALNSANVGQSVGGG
jgi:hypothetical protein